VSQIQADDKNAIVAALLNWCLLGGVGYYYLGQSGKGLRAIIVTVVFYVVLLGWIPALAFSIDAYMLGQKLANGEAIGENECGLSFLSGLFGMLGAKDE
jgi:TM2 domain-containing membrane protein YozV